MYPRISINLDYLSHNTKYLISKLDGIEIFAVTKGFSADLEIISTLIDSGIKSFADSRIENLKSIKEAFNVYTIQLRLPMKSEIDAVVKFANCSLNSEIETIRLLNQAASSQSKVHDVILMIDVGDLREGIMYNDNNIINVVEEIIGFSNINLIGLGTNVTCYGSILPTPQNLQILIDLKDIIYKNLNYTIQFISGGNSSSIYLCENNELPKEVNNLRIGEAILKGVETAFANPIANMEQDAFILEAQIIELKNKPSFPIGKRSINAFGETVEYHDMGIHTRAIIAIGRQDVDLENLVPIDEKISIIGGSSDHTILEVPNNYLLGDVIEFKLNYGSILSLFTSKYVKKHYKKDGKKYE